MSQRAIDSLFLFIICGMVVSHFLRIFIKNSNWLILPVEKALPRLFFSVVLACMLAAIMNIGVYNFFTAPAAERIINKIGFLNRVLMRMIDYCMFFLPWIIFYYLYHYVNKIRKQEMDTLRLEALVKELELKTIKSHINPHFIFNALNSIRALIDEDPSRARKAVTELSTILRSSMQTGKLETVPLEKELKIVKDYLALEYIRFEERLQVEYDISENTLHQPIPPMMLQTLVENAIKHGISKKRDGGLVRVSSRIFNNSLELVIQNTGILNGYPDSGGFGLTSTQNRLSLLFGERAVFRIRQLTAEVVEAKVLIPMTH